MKNIRGLVVLALLGSSLSVGAGMAQSAKSADELVALLAVQCREAGRQLGEFTPAELDMIDAYFVAHPPNGGNALERLKVFQLLDRLAVVTARNNEWPFYITAVQGSPYARQRAALLEKGGVPYLMTKRLSRAFACIARREVTPGHVAVTLIYNMGFVIETPDVAVGVDLAGPHVEDLAPVLNAIVITHGHADHVNTLLSERMRSLRKPIYASPRNAEKGFTAVTENQHVAVGPMEFIGHLGDHYPEAYTKYAPQTKAHSIEMLDPTIRTDIRPGQPSLTFYHPGDDFDKHSILTGFKGGRLDVLLGRGTPDPAYWRDLTVKNAQAYKDLNDAIGDPGGVVVALQPRLFLPGHVCELGHGLNIGGLMPFNDAFGVAALLPAERSAVLMWGERLVLDAARPPNEALIEGR